MLFASNINNDSMEDIGSGDLSPVIGSLDRHQKVGIMEQAKTLIAAPKIKKNLEKLKASYMEMKAKYEAGTKPNHDEAEALIAEFTKLRDGVATLSEMLSGNADAISALSLLNGQKGAANAMQSLIDAPKLIDGYINSIIEMMGEPKPNQ